MGYSRRHSANAPLDATSVQPAVAGFLPSVPAARPRSSQNHVTPVLRR